MLTIDLSGQTAVVTGASRGIGLAVTRALAGNGARVIAGALHTSAELAQLAAGGAVQVLEVDLARPDGPAELVALAGGEAGLPVGRRGYPPPGPCRPG
jgi:NAD(P)-dependent dehydrogenase (short-subunit alcohol dehydrogenase family)